MYLGTFFVPGLVLIQICLLFRGQKKRRKKTASAVAVLMVFILSCTGCAGIEPEKRMYPLAMGVDVSEGEYILTYAMPDLPERPVREKRKRMAIRHSRSVGKVLRK